jgi:hypothetical protein
MLPHATPRKDFFPRFLPLRPASGIDPKEPMSAFSLCRRESAHSSLSPSPTATNGRLPLLPRTNALRSSCPLHLHLHLYPTRGHSKALPVYAHDDETPSEHMLETLLDFSHRPPLLGAASASSSSSSSSPRPSDQPISQSKDAFPTA